MKRPQSKRKEKEQEQRRNDILDVAMKQFHSNGYDSVSMSGIARDIGIKKPTLYLYFKNKETLFFAGTIRGATIANALARKEAEKGKAGSTARAIGRFYGKHPEYAWADRFFRSGRFDLENTENEDIKKILDLQKEMFDTVSESIGAGMDDGELTSDVEPLVMAVWTAIVTESTNNLRPDHKYVLARGGIGPGQFAMETMRLMKRAVMVKEKA